MVNEFKIINPFKFQSLNKPHYMKSHVVRNAPQIHKTLKLQVLLREINPKMLIFTLNSEVIQNIQSIKNYKLV